MATPASLLTYSAESPKNNVLKRQMGICLFSLLFKKKKKDSGEKKPKTQKILMVTGMKSQVFTMSSKAL